MKEGAFATMVLIGTMELAASVALWLIYPVYIFNIFFEYNHIYRDFIFYITLFTALATANGVLMITGPAFSRKHGYKRGATVPTSCILRLGQLGLTIWLLYLGVRFPHTNIPELDLFLHDIWGPFYQAAIVYSIVVFLITFAFNRASTPN